MQIKSLKYSNQSWRSQTIQLYICQMPQIIQIIKKVLSLNYSSTFKIQLP